MHKCGDPVPFVSDIDKSSAGSGSWIVTATITHQRPLQSVEIKVGDTVLTATSTDGSTYTATYSGPSGTKSVTVTATDDYYYVGTSTENLNF